MHKYILFLFFFSGFTAVAEPVLIRGKAIDYAGDRAAVFSVEDYISGKRKLLQVTDIAENGVFSFNLEINETQAIFICIRRMEGLLYAEPGHRYNVVFPPPQSAEFRRFDKTEVALEFIDLDVTDLNIAIRDFNSDYISFVNQHYYDFAAGEYQNSSIYVSSLGNRKDGIDLYKTSGQRDSVPLQILSSFGSVVEDFMDTISIKYEQSAENEYFADYMRYSLAEIKMLAGMKKKLFYKEYFMSQQLLVRNPAFIKCFELFYHDFLLHANKEQQGEVIKAINVERDPNRLIGIFENDSAALSRQVRTLAVIKGLNDIYFNKTFSKPGIEKTLQNLSENEKDPELKKIALNAFEEMKKCKEGWQSEDFILIDDHDDKWTLSDHEGRPIYLMFYASWSAQSVKEMLMMRKWHELYEKDILFVAISMDDSYDQFKKYLSENRDQKFTFLYGGGDPLLPEKFGVRSIPHAIMLDEKGKFMYSLTRKPSEGIQAEFDKVKARAAQNANKGTKTWQDKQ